MNRRDVLLQLGTLALVASPAGLVLAQGSSAFTTLKPAVPSGNAEGKIEVIEFFHYGCNHCRAFDPLINIWKQKLPADVVFTRVPVIWSEEAKGWAALYYSLQAINKLDGVHEKVFAAVQDGHLPLHQLDGARAWVVRQGVDEKAFTDAYRSFGLPARVRGADQLAKEYKITGVPTVAVGGKYTTSASQAGSHEATLQTADRLIERVRKG
ncbi:thiol:disulfide interchange protein [Betaproteobacteria bacterium]|nr:thiol:disulfide interchange protein [Betaproteobacteria bacterium]GHT99884.1 thiol:disulfide interchange protein [Betaproteobacteria bacterium]GHU00656.1 thiol:disulfide interchange protein [Betaproteobacteria bacterium]GHU12298.1 thiol:disulfide interchange protein [Betaproteobacteria bacterium]GHU19718.1 thiol:disulfide interchange protein [Betaproteobacteria bacterium]